MTDIGISGRTTSAGCETVQAGTAGVRRPNGPGNIPGEVRRFQSVAPEFAEVLQRAEADGTINSLLAAAVRQGWTKASLAKVLGISDGAVAYRTKRAEVDQVTAYLGLVPNPPIHGPKVRLADTRLELAPAVAAEMAKIRAELVATRRRIPRPRLLSDLGTESVFRLVREVRDLDVVAWVTVEGEPASKARARFSGYGSTTRAYTPEETKQAETKTAWKFRASAPGWKVDPESEFGVIALFLCSTRHRRDVDNMLKLILDAFNKVVWKDDMQVSEVSARVVRGCPEPSTEIVIYRLPVFNPAPTMPCRRCGATFRRYPSLRLQVYCSGVCEKAARADDRIKVCLNCGIEFEGKERSTYCSRKCSNAHRTVILDCIECGTPFSRPQSQRDYGKPFCNPDCLQAYWSTRRTSKPKGTCDTCGESTASTKSKNCHGCAVLARRALQAQKALNPYAGEIVLTITDLGGGS